MSEAEYNSMLAAVSAAMEAGPQDNFPGAMVQPMRRAASW